MRDSSSASAGPAEAPAAVDALPLDHPTPGRPPRIYAALTNHCNRACPWCSTCSSGAGSTWLEPTALAARLPAEGRFELQLEGGEPTLHPHFWSFVALARGHPRCARLVLCTNGVALPRSETNLGYWLARLGAPLTLKLSVNHHLLARDPGLLALATALRDHIAAAGGERLLVLNVRRRRGRDDDDAAVVEAVGRAGLMEHANVFFLQRYGFAARERGWDPPFLAGHDFILVNPDGSSHGQDLIGRSEAMRRLP